MFSLVNLKDKNAQAKIMMYFRMNLKERILSRHKNYISLYQLLDSMSDEEILKKGDEVVQSCKAKNKLKVDSQLYEDIYNHIIDYLESQV